jgi:molybdopterin converting factor subunit 1
MRVNVLLFGPVREWMGCERIDCDLPGGANVAALAERLAGDSPVLRARLPALRFAVNQTFVERRHVLTDGDEVAIIPPVSGG